jgi:hypothetical protein
MTGADFSLRSFWMSERPSSLGSMTSDGGVVGSGEARCDFLAVGATVQRSRFAKPLTTNEAILLSSSPPDAYPFPAKHRPFP